MVSDTHSGHPWIDTEVSERLHYCNIASNRCLMIPPLSLISYHPLTSQSQHRGLSSRHHSYLYLLNVIRKHSFRVTPLEPSCAACVAAFSSGASAAALAPSVTAASTQPLLVSGLAGDTACQYTLASKQRRDKKKIFSTPANIRLLTLAASP